MFHMMQKRWCGWYGLYTSEQSPCLLKCLRGNLCSYAIYIHTIYKKGSVFYLTEMTKGTSQSVYPHYLKF